MVAKPHFQLSLQSAKLAFYQPGCVDGVDVADSSLLSGTKAQLFNIRALHTQTIPHIFGIVILDGLKTYSRTDCNPSSQSFGLGPRRLLIATPCISMFKPFNTEVLNLVQ